MIAREHAGSVAFARGATGTCEGAARVLIVAGDSQRRAELRRMLPDRYAPCEADSLAAALAATGAGVDCLLVVDEPPQLDALSLLVELHSAGGSASCPHPIGSLPAWPVVIVTTASERERERAALRLGATEWVDASCTSAAELDHAIERAFDRFTALARREPHAGLDPGRSLDDGEPHGSEPFLRRVLDNLFVFVAVLELDGTLLEINRVSLETSGIGLADVRGHKFWDCYWWEHGDGARERVHEACERAARGESVRFDLRARLASGQMLDVDLQIAPLRDASGRITHLIPSGIDITERKRADALLRDSESRYRTLFESVEQGVCVIQVIFDADEQPIDYRFLEVNPAFERHAGFSAPLDKTVRELIPQLDEFWCRVFGRVALTGEATRFERYSARLQRWLDVSAHRLGAPTDRKIAVLFSDVTERKNAESALKQSEARFRALADNMSQLAWMADAQGEVTWYNQRWLEYTGMTPEQLRACGWRALQHPDHIDRVTKKIEHCLASCEPWEDTFPLRSKDGQYRWFLARALPIGDRSSGVRWFGTHTDITAQREAEDTLRAAVHLRDEFLSVASHELRTPLTALVLQLEGLARFLARESGEHGHPAAARVERAITQCERLGSLIERLLSVSRIMAARFELECERCNLAELIDDAVERLDELARQSGSELRVISNDEIIGVWDRDRLDQVLMNLLTNAIKYGAGWPIEIATCSVGDQVEISVRDRGMGIARADQARIFERFERAVSSHHYSGLGLGLYISREIVVAHGGVIEVSSAPGSGATFIVRLPRVALGCDEVP